MDHNADSMNMTQSNGSNEVIPSGSNAVHSTSGSNSGHNANRKWYWFWDESGDIEWIPYKDEHQFQIEKAWNEQKDSVIVMQRFKIEFNREGGDQFAAGKQHNYTIHDGWRRDVIRGVPDNHYTINGIRCSKLPK